MSKIKITKVKQGRININILPVEGLEPSTNDSMGEQASLVTTHLIKPLFCANNCDTTNSIFTPYNFKNTVYLPLQGCCKLYLYVFCHFVPS